MDYARYGRLDGDDVLRGSARPADEALCGTIRADGISRAARLVELGLRGGAIETTLSVRAGDEVGLVFAVPGQAPIVVERGIVRFVDDDRIGVEFVRMSDADRARYRMLVRGEFRRLSSQP